MRGTRRLGALSLIALFAFAACSSTGASSTPAVSAAPASAAASEVASTAPSEAPSASVNACAKASLALLQPGTLTIGTDNPAYPPYFAPKDGGNSAPWDKDQGDPTSGKGFESAVAYAVADKLGFTPAEVAWVVVPFANVFAPGAKKFDFDINQTTYKPERAQNVDFSDGYYFGNQSVVALKSNPVAKATSIADLAGARFGAQSATTSLDAIMNVIKPTKEPRAYDSNDAAVEALKVKTIDALVVDLPTADYVTNVQVPGSTIVGQLDQGTPEHFSLALAKGSTLTACVNQAIAALTADGTLKKLADQYLPFATTTPVIKP